LVCKICSGLALALLGEKSANRPPAERAELMLDEPDFVVWAANEILAEEGAAAGKHMVRTGVVAAMYTTWKKSQKDATRFWLAVKNETGDKPKCPDRVYSKFLLTTGVGNGSQNSRRKIKVASAREMMVKGIHAWNAWRIGETPKSLAYHVESKVPNAV